MSENKFNVGDIVKYNTITDKYEYTVIVADPDVEGDIVIMETEGSYRFEKEGRLQLIPKHTKEELLAYDAYRSIVHLWGSIESVKECKVYQSILRLVKLDRIK
jgi:hypothetical protein